MKKFFIAIVLILADPLPGLSQDVGERIDELVTAYVNNGTFSGAILVADKGKVIYKKAFGLADLELEVPLSVDSRFKIASLSKPFTALAVLMLAEEGKIRLDGTIRDYIPWYPGPLGDSITIHQLLTHTSGIRSNLDPQEEMVKQRLHHDPEELIRYAASADLLFRPGTKFGYSNFAYNILAYIVQTVTGKPFAVVLKDRIFNPAGMKHTCQYDNSRIEEKLAQGYEYKLLYGYRNADFVDASFTLGAGGLVSTVEDLYLFDRALRSGILLNAKDLAKSFNPNQPGNYGYGWFINQVNIQGQAAALLIADHSGSIDGFGAYMARVLNDSSFIVVLKNQRTDTYIDPAYAPEIGRQILSVLYGDQVIPPKKSIARHIACKIGNQCVDSALAEYYRVAASHSGQFNMEESELNKLGIELYFRFNRMDDALQVFRVNMEQFPQSYNTYDSYAYLLMQKGDHENAVRYYKKGLEVLTKYPQANEGESVKNDAEKARAYIRKMEGDR